MTDFASPLRALRRPRILIRAARAGLVDYGRERHPRRAGRGEGSGPEASFDALLAEESALEAHRTAGGATYDPRRHIRVLTALLAAARPTPDPALP